MLVCLMTNSAGPASLFVRMSIAVANHNCCYRGRFEGAKPRYGPQYRSNLMLTKLFNLLDRFVTYMYVVFRHSASTDQRSVWGGIEQR